MDFVQNWSVEIGSNHGTAPVFYPDDEHSNSIVVSGEDGRTHRIAPDGHEIFVYDMGVKSSCSPVVGDLDGDGLAEIVNADFEGNIHCLSGEGKLLWQYAAGGRINYTMAIADVDGDGKKELIATTKSGWVTCLGHGGKLRWKFMAEPQSGPVAVGDINHDGSPEIVFGSDLGKIYCIDARGKYLWHREIDGHFGRSLPLIADPDGDGSMEVLITRSEVCSNAAVLALDGLTGGLLWEGRTTLHGYGPLAVADIDGDGITEIIDVDKSTTIYCFSPDGKRKWAAELEGHGIFFPPGIADLDGDGRVELVTGIRRENAVIILDNTGHEIQRIPVMGGTNSAPAVTDLDGDGRLEIYMVSQNPGKIVQLENDEAKSGKVLWGSWRGNVQRTGYVPSRAEKLKKSSFSHEKKIKTKDGGSLEALLGENRLTVKLPQEIKETGLLFQASLSAVDDRTVTTLELIGKGEHEKTAKFSLLNAGDHTLEITLFDKTSGSISRTRYDVSADGFVADIDFFKDKLTKLDELKTSVGPGRLTDIEMIEILRNSMIIRQKMLERDAATFAGMSDADQAAYAKIAQEKREESDRDMSFTRFLAAQRRAGVMTPFVCWEDPNPWDNIPAHEIYPKGDIRAEKLELLALGNEYESRAVYVTNLSAEPLHIKVMPVEWSSIGQKFMKNEHILQLREVVEAGTDFGGTVPDALPLLNEGSIILVPPMGNRQLWLTFNTHGLEGGDYIGTLKLLAPGMDDAEAEIPLNLHVSSVSLPEKSPYHFYTWAHFDTDPEAPLNQKRLDDLLAHRTTVFSVGAPRQQYDAAGNLTVEPDWTRHDKWMKKYQGKGIVLIPSFQNSVTGPEEAPIWSEPWEKAYKAALRRYVAHLKAMGFGYEDFALYPYDEPWLTGMSVANMLIKVAKLSKEADPNVQIYCDPAGMVSPENSAEAAKYIDIWMPQIDLLKEDKRLLEFYKSTGAQVWAYEAPGHARMLKPLGLYRMQPWLAFRYGLTGSGIWTYNYGNIWLANQPATGGNAYSLVYEDGQTVVPSRRWEAYRDGVEDYIMLTMLKDIADGQTKSFLDEAILKITAGQEEATSISRLIIDYDTDYAVIMKYRKAMIEILENSSGRK